MKSFTSLITKMTQAAVSGDGDRVAECFTADGLYHDCFYGTFQGQDIARLITDFFHRDATNFRWDLHNPVEQGEWAYVRYVFSYNSRLPGAKGRRGMFEGVCVCQLKDGKIHDYHEVANAGTGLKMVGFSPERLDKFMTREADALAARPESRAHISSTTAETV